MKIIPKNKKLVIFDCDGVLVDSEILSYETYAKVFAQDNFEVSPDELLHQLSGLSIDDMISTLEKKRGKSFNKGIKDKIAQAIVEAFTKKLKPIPGVISLLQKLVDAEIDFCVVSNGLKSRVSNALRVTGLEKYFTDQQIFDVSQVKNGKPAPDLLLHAAHTTGHDPHDCFVIDDSVTGIKAGLAAGMTVIGFLGGAHAQPAWYRERVLNANPTHLAYDMEAVGKIILI